MLLFAGYLGITQRSDSLFIYNFYKGQIDSIKSTSLRMDYTQWYSIADKKDSGLACAFLRLKKINGKDYLPVRRKEVEGFGVAYEYPHPDSIYDFSFSVLYPPTKFILKDNGLTKIPYLELWYFNKEGHRLKIKIVNPVTLSELSEK